MVVDYCGMHGNKKSENMFYDCDQYLACSKQNQLGYK